MLNVQSETLDFKVAGTLHVRGERPRRTIVTFHLREHQIPKFLLERLPLRKSDIGER